MTLLLERPRIAPCPQVRILRAPAPDARLLGLDAARMLGCLGVIWMHVGYSAYNGLGYFRMPFFTAMLAYLVAWSSLHHPPRSPQKFVIARAMRILLPYVCWVALYRLPGLLQGHPFINFKRDSLYMGWGAPHLWYLPFAFLASILAYGFAWSLSHLRGPYRLTAAIALALIGTAGCFAPSYVKEGDNWWNLSSPLLGTIPIGVALAFLQEYAPVHHFLKATWWFAALLWAAFVLFSRSPEPGQPNYFGYFAGIFLLVAGAGAPLTRPVWLWKYLGQLAYGMYLTHWGFIVFAGKLGIQGDGSALVRMGLVVLLSAAAAALLLHVHVGRALLGMEPLWKRTRPARQPTPATTMPASA